MKLKIVYDNEARPKYRKDWGFACIIEIADERILFDTGADGKILRANMKEFGVSPEKIDRIILSHDHLDHVGGLFSIQGGNIEVYILPSFSNRLKEKIAAHYHLHEVSRPQKIRESVWTTGELGTSIKEQSLVIKSTKGLVIITGCSHPGVRNIFSAASSLGNIWGLIGGLHGFQEFELLKSLELIVPSHCTQYKEKIAELYPQQYIKSEAGSEITIE